MSTFSFMRHAIRSLICILLVSVFALPSSGLRAQTYIVDSPFLNEAKAFEGELVKDGQGIDHVSFVYDAPFVTIPNGQKITVKGRCYGDSRGIEQGDVKAIVEVDGKRYYMDAFLLKYDESQSGNAPDIFAGEDFSPNTFVIGGKDDAWQKRLNQMDIHSSDGKFWYGATMPALIVVLIFVAFIIALLALGWLPQISRLALWVSPVLMLGAITAEYFYMVRMGGESVWWCNKDIVGLSGAIIRSVPFMLAMAMQIAFVFVYVKLFNRIAVLDIPVKWSFISIFIAIIPGFFLAAYMACWISGISPNANFVNDLTPEQWSGFIWKFAVLFAVILALPPMAISGIGSASIKGAGVGLFFAIYFFATIAAVILLIIAVTQLIWAVVIELLAGVIVIGAILLGGAATGGHPGQSGNGYWIDDNGRRHTSGGSGRRLVQK